MPDKPAKASAGRLSADNGRTALLLATGAFLLGSLWRIRGSEGFGSFWGMLTVSLCFCLFLFVFFVPREKISGGIFLATVLSMAITAGGWGTLNTQITGLLSSGVPFSGEQAVSYVPISPLSGVAMMLCLGFGWMPLFAYFAGRFFAGRPHTFRQTIFAVALYYLVMWLSMFTVAHAVLYLINPQAVDLFARGLEDRGYFSSSWLSYVTHFDNSGWAKTIPGGRNYFASVNAIASALGTAALAAYVRRGLKDKAASCMLLKICGVVALSITIADLWLYWSVGGYQMNSLTPPPWLDGWQMWEYGTGFLSGLGIMLLFTRAGRGRAAEPQTADTGKAGKFSSVAGCVFRLVFVPIVFLGSVLKPLTDNVGLPFTHAFVLLPLAAFAVLYGLWLLLKRRKAKNLPAAVGRRWFAVLCPLYYGIYAAIYFTFADSYGVVWLLMIISAAAVYLGYGLLFHRGSRTA